MTITIGDRFGRLTVEKKATSITGGKTMKHKWGAWECRCDCGETTIVMTVHLNRGAVQSCGCLKTEPKTLQSGQRFNRLTTVRYERGKWICRCDCGETTIVKTNSLVSGNTRSCGCLKKEVNQQKTKMLRDGRRKYEPRIASAVRVWRQYRQYDPEFIELKDFLSISQQPCRYCGCEGSNHFNAFAAPSSRGSVESIALGEFQYNGIDRIDVTKPHTIDNVASCCAICNRAKSNVTLEDFLARDYRVHPFTPIEIKPIHLPQNRYVVTSIRCVMYKYRDTDLTLEEFYSLSQMNCFYCDGMPNNRFNRAASDKKASLRAKQEGEFVYCGLDRIDSTLGHYRLNVVPCCRYCNFAKSKMTFIEFQEWIERLIRWRNKKRPA